VLNPGGVRGPDGALHLFPRLIAEGNYSRIGHARAMFENDRPVGVERMGLALEPHESYEVSAGGGGIEDPRVVYIPLLERYVMTYTAFVPYARSSSSATKTPRSSRNPCSILTGCGLSRFCTGRQPASGCVLETKS
jgi:predicted GH43/DUF377 family glycosyl hydrolase